MFCSTGERPRNRHSELDRHRSARPPGALTIGTMEQPVLKQTLFCGFSLAMLLADLAANLAVGNAGRAPLDQTPIERTTALDGLDLQQRAGKARAETAAVALLGQSAVSVSIEGTPIALKRVAVSSTREGTTWSGIVAETGESGLLMRWKDGRFGGVLGYRGQIYGVTLTGGSLNAALEKDMRNPGRQAERIPQHAADSLRRLVQRAPRPSRPPGQETAPFSEAERSKLETKKTTIDVMIVYTKNAARHYVLPMQDLIARAVEETNQSFRNSGLGNISLRLVHTQLVDYDETNGEHFDHLYRMVDGLGPFRDVHRLRDEKRADIVGMIIDDPSGCGLSTRVAPDAEEAYFVVHHSCAAVTLSLAHEIGHILGARHDRDSDENEAPFPYGHGYVNGDKWRDIMSYQQSCAGCPRIPFWSNPRITYKGEPTGTAEEDNARVILQQAARVASFR